MKVLVTGGGGYLGTVLVRQLLAQGHAVTVLDRFSWGTQPLAAVDRRGATRRGLQVVLGDIRHLTHVANAVALAGSDVIIHLAAVVGYPACDADPEDAETTNVDGTRNIAACAEGRRLLFASTGSTYGKVEGIATEETPLSPLTRYGRTKAEGEQIVLEAGGTVLRLATLFGLSPRMRWDLLPNDFARRAVTTGELRVYDRLAHRTFLHVEDAARLFTYACRGHLLPGIYNGGVPQLNLTKGAVADHVRDLTGCRVVEAVGHDPDGRDCTVSYLKIREAWEGHAAHPFDLSDVVEFARVWK